LNKRQSEESESIVIDPDAMNIVNRVAPGSRSVGEVHYVGGVLVEGIIDGAVHVTGGPIVLMPGGAIRGTVKGDGDAFLAGTIEYREGEVLSEVVVQGTVYIVETLVAMANITAGAFKTYHGARVEGHIRSLGLGSPQ